MHIKSHSLVKFRPVLTLSQLHHIVQNMNPESELGKSVIKVLVPMIAKVEVGAISPAYTLSETHAIKSLESARRISYESGTMSPEDEAKYEAEIMGI